MADPGKITFTKFPAGTLLGLNSIAPYKLFQTDTSGNTSQVPINDPTDPQGLKPFLAFDVAHGAYTHGAQVDPNQDVSSDLKVNSDTRAVQLNFYAQLDSKKHNYKWTLIQSTDLQSLTSVGAVMDLLYSNFSP